MLGAREVAGLVGAVDGDGVVRAGGLEGVPPVDAVIAHERGVGVPAGVDDSRPAVGVQAEAEQVVVAVATLTEPRAVIHHMGPRREAEPVAAPPISEHQVTGVLEAPGRSRRWPALLAEGGGPQQLGVVVQLAATAQQGPLPTVVRVAEQGDAAVRPLQPHRPLQRAVHPLEQCRLEPDPVAPSQVHEVNRGFGDQLVVVARHLDMDPVGQQVGQQVGRQLDASELGQVVGRRQLGEQHTDAEHAGQLERAVVAHGFEVRRDVHRLFADPLHPSA